MSRMHSGLAAATLATLVWAALAWPSEANAQCAPVDIALDTAVPGTLASGDCTIAQLGIDPQDTSFVDVYRVQLASDGFLTIGLEASFDAFLWVLDETLTEVITIDDDSGPGLDSLLSQIPFDAGTYIILANSVSSDETGSYTLTTTFELTGYPACDVVVDLPPSAVAQGTLSSEDCTIAQLGVNRLDFSFVDPYRVTLPTGGPLTISLESDAFDTYLWVLDETLTQEIATNDDGGQGTNSLLSDLALDPGAYVILANAFFEGDTGSYTLTLLPEPSAALLGASALGAALALARRRRCRPH